VREEHLIAGPINIYYIINYFIYNKITFKVKWKWFYTDILLTDESVSSVAIKEWTMNIDFIIKIDSFTLFIYLVFIPLYHLR